jgi:hypothetical protein
VSLSRLLVALFFIRPRRDRAPHPVLIFYAYLAALILLSLSFCLGTILFFLRTYRIYKATRAMQLAANRTRLYGAPGVPLPFSRRLSRRPRVFYGVRL